MSGVAIFHDNLAQMGGAERVALALTKALPGAALHTTLAARAKLVPELREMAIHTTWMRHLPAPGRLYRHYFLLYPLAVESVDLSKYDLVVSSCFGYAKGVKRRAGAVHVCYCHTPMRWVWRYDDYFGRERLGRLQRQLMPRLIKPLRRWDLRASTRPDFFIANSEAVAQRIRQFYRRDAVVIPPPIDVQRFHTSTTQGDFYLIVSRLVAYKRIELAIEACNQLRRRLVIIGGGPDRERLESLAGPTIEFMGRQPDAVVTQMAAECRALLFPGEEDFGMAPLEANAAGRPVVAWRGGGALETVRDGSTGVFFDQPTSASLQQAIERLESRAWDPLALRAHASGFDISIFIQRIQSFLREVVPVAPVEFPLAAAHG